MTKAEREEAKREAYDAYWTKRNTRRSMWCSVCDGKVRNDDDLVTTTCLECGAKNTAVLPPPPPMEPEDDEYPDAITQAHEPAATGGER